MAEIRSFLIGVVIAGALLGIVAIALGAFDSEGEEAPTARLLGTPPPSATARSPERPAATSLPTSAATRAPSPTPQTTSAAAAATTVATSAPQATAAPTNTPAPQPTANPVTAYVNTASPIVSDIVAQIDYLVGQGSSNPAGSTVAANTVKDLAARLQAVSAPACVAGAHGTLTQGGSAASVAADQLIVALSSNNPAAVQTALGNLSAARSTLNQGADAIRNASC